MKEAQNPNTSSAANELRITRVLNASRERVFDAWTDPARITQWWGPNGFTTTTKEMTTKPGGTWVFTMHGPDGTDFLNKIIYLEVNRPERLSYKHSGDGETKDIHFHTIVTFEDENGKTRLTMRTIFDTPAELQHVVKEYGAIEGGNQTVQRLADFLEKA